MITDFISNVLIIDDKFEEVSGLKEILENREIGVLFFTPVKFQSVSFSKNRQLIFLDLSLDDSKKIIENIAVIRRMLKKSIGNLFGIYGIVMWSKHQGHIDTLRDKLQEDRKNKAYTTPIFVVGLDKLKYIKAGNYNDLLVDIEEVLSKDTAATFFLEWSNSVQSAKSDTINKIYSLMPNYQNQSDDISVILTTLALNHTGLNKNDAANYPLNIDAFKAFDEILAGELANSHKTALSNIVDTTKTFSDATQIPSIYSHLNSVLLIDNNNLEQNIVIPGNVYKIQNDSLFKSDKAPDNSISIVIEITPPCDFSNKGKKVNARLIGGFLVPSESNIKKQIDSIKCNKECFYREVYPIMIPNESNPHIMILDFRFFGAERDENLIDSNKYSILFRAKPKLFADILQKFSSHAARLGLSVIHP